VYLREFCIDFNGALGQQFCRFIQTVFLPIFYYVDVVIVHIFKCFLSANDYLVDPLKVRMNIFTQST
jgi:hypothetical protein